MNTPSMETLALRRENEALRAEVASLKEEAKTARVEAECLAASCKAASDQCSTLKEELGRQKACNQDMVVTVHSLTQQLANSEATVKSLRAALEHMENTLIEVSGQVKSEDARRLDWVQSEVDSGGMFALEKFGGAWVKLFTASNQHMKQKPSVRTAIDAAISAQESKK